MGIDDIKRRAEQFDKDLQEENSRLRGLAWAAGYDTTTANYGHQSRTTPNGGTFTEFRGDLRQGWTMGADGKPVPPATPGASKPTLTTAAAADSTPKPPTPAAPPSPPSFAVDPKRAAQARADAHAAGYDRMATGAAPYSSPPLTRAAEQPNVKPTAAPADATATTTTTATGNTSTATSGASEFNVMSRDLINDREGGYGYTPTDSGGPTKFGISSAWHGNWKPGMREEDARIRLADGTEVHPRDLTREQALAIYKEEYWDKIGAESWPTAIREMAFDTAVLQGPGVAQRLVKESGGDFNRFLELRLEAIDKLTNKTPAERAAWKARARALAAKGPWTGVAAREATTTAAATTPGTGAATTSSTGAAGLSAGLAKLGLNLVDPKTGRMDPDAVFKAMLPSDTDTNNDVAGQQAIYDQELLAMRGGTDAKGNKITGALNEGVGKYVDQVRSDKSFTDQLPDIRHRIAPGAAAVAQALASFGSALSGNQTYDQAMRQQIQQAEQDEYADKAQQRKAILEEAHNRRMTYLNFQAQQLQTTFQELMRRRQFSAASVTAAKAAELQALVFNAQAEQQAAMKKFDGEVELTKSLLAAGVFVGPDGKTITTSTSRSATGGLFTEKDYNDAVTNNLKAWVDAASQKKPDANLLNVLQKRHFELLSTFHENETTEEMVNRVQAGIPNLVAQFGIDEKAASKVAYSAIETSIRSMVTRSVAAKKELVPGVAAYAWTLQKKDGDLISAAQFKALTGQDAPAIGATPAPPPPADGTHSHGVDKSIPRGSYNSLAGVEQEVQRTRQEALKDPEISGAVAAGDETAINRYEPYSKALRIQRLLQNPPRPTYPDPSIPPENRAMNVMRTRVNNLEAELRYYEELHNLGYYDPGHDVDNLMRRYAMALKEYQAYVTTHAERTAPSKVRTGGRQTLD